MRDHQGDGACRGPCARRSHPAEQLSADYIVPSVFDRSVAPLVARAVAEAAMAAGVARIAAEGGEDSRPQGATW